MTLLKQLKNQNILSVLREGSGRTASVLCFSKLLNIIELGAPADLPDFPTIPIFSPAEMDRLRCGKHIRFNDSK